MHLTNRSVLRLVILATLFASGTVHAAKCKFQQDSVDKFTKVRTIWTRWNPLESFFGDLGNTDINHPYGYVSASYVAGEISVRVKIELSGPSKFPPQAYELEDAIVVPEGARLLLMMADETIVTLFSNQEERANFIVTPPETGTNITRSFWMDAEADLHYPLDGEALAVLTSLGATNIRVEAVDTHYDVAIHKKSFGDIAQAIECIQDAL